LRCRASIWRATLLVLTPIGRTWLRFAEESLRPWSDKSPIAKFVTDLTAKAYGRKGTQPFSVLMISFALVALW
jgi:hypothetical protein